MRIAPGAVIAAVAALALWPGGASRTGAVHADQDRDPRDAERGVVAVLRRDGIALPFAAFDGDRWTMKWPAQLTALDIPATLAAIPPSWWGGDPPQRWRAWRAAGGPGNPIEVTAPTVYPQHCRPRLGLRTSYKSPEPLPPVGIEPHPKDGLAISGGATLEPIESVDPRAWPALTMTLLDALNRVEDTTVLKVRRGAGWNHPLSGEERRKLPIRLEAWYRAPAVEAGETVSYIEAVRQVPPGADDQGCGLETFFSGWVRHRGDAVVSPITVQGRVAYCDRVGVQHIFPFGRLTLEGKMFWIYQLSGWDSEWYDVTQVSPGKVRDVLEVFGGRRVDCAGKGPSEK